LKAHSKEAPVKTYFKEAQMSFYKKEKLGISQSDLKAHSKEAPAHRVAKTFWD